MLSPRLASFALIASLVGAEHLSAQTLFVDADLTTGANDGSSWSDAYQGADGFRSALDSVTPGAEIWLTAGNYVAADASGAEAAFLLFEDDVAIRGGFLGGESSPEQRPARGQAPTVLDGDILGDDPFGSTIENLSSPLTLLGASPTVDRVDVVRSGPFGGGIAVVLLDGHAELIECSMRDCTGGGLVVLGLGDTPVTFRAVDCSFENNVGPGATLTAENLVSLELDGCVSIGNLDGFYFVNGWPADTGVRNCVAYGNRDYGFRFAEPSSGDSGALVQGSTIADNGLGGILYVPLADTASPGVTVRNSILWGNGGPGAGADAQFVGQGAVPQLILSSIVQGATPSGTLYAFDPLFVDAANGDYSLQSGSPAIDRGDGVVIREGELDASRRHRAVDVASAPNLGPASMDAVDIGAFESSGAIGDNAGCAAELNSTGRAGRLFAEGSAVASSNDFALRADRLPPGQFGLFLASQQRGFAPMTGGSGTLCLGGAIGRFNGAGQIQASSTEGTLDLDVDLTAVPQPASLAAVQPGETWVFQLWHRDVVAPVGATSQFTGVAAVRFE